MLTVKGAATRQRIIDGAADEIREHGIARATLDDICRRSATGKSQLFHYFPGGREELLLAVAAREADRVLADQQPYLGALTSWAAWQAWRDAVIDRYRRQGAHCPLGVLITELGRHTPAAQAVTRELLRQWQAQVQAGIAAMQQRGDVAAGIDPARTAPAIVAGIQGGVTVLMATGSVEHLAAALDTALDYLRGGAPAATGPGPSRSRPAARRLVRQADAWAARTTGRGPRPQGTS